MTARAVSNTASRTEKRGDRRNVLPLMILRSPVWHFCRPDDYPPVVLAVPGRSALLHSWHILHILFPPLLFAQPSRSWPMFATHLLQLYPTLSSLPLILSPIPILSFLPIRPSSPHNEFLFTTFLLFFARISPLSFFLSLSLSLFFLFVLYVIVVFSSFFFCCLSFLPMFLISNSQCNSTVLKNKRVRFSFNPPVPLSYVYGFLFINQQHLVLPEKKFLGRVVDFVCVHSSFM